MDINIEIVRSFFLWCTILNAVLLLFSFLMVTCVGAGDWVYKMHSRFFPISKEVFYTAMYSFYGAMKLIVIMFNLVPYLALVIAG